MTGSIIGTLSSRGILLNELALQSYDYAIVMSGQFNGAQQKISELLDRSLPKIPCQIHALNIAIEHSCDSSLMIVELLNILDNITRSFLHLQSILPPLKNNPL